jgi:hypothetical protein
MADRCIINQLLVLLHFNLFIISHVARIEHHYLYTTVFCVITELERNEILILF